MVTAKVILGDCLQVMRGMDAESVDAVMMDPPYGIGFAYNEHDDSEKAYPGGYGAWLWSVCEAAERLAKPGAPIFVFQAMTNIRRFAEWFPREWRIYAACKNFVQMRPVAMQYAWDPVVCWWKEGGKPLGGDDKKRGVNRDYFIANTAPVIARGRDIRNSHPCPRPLDQMRVMVSTWVPRGGVVLDPCCGSGTTGVAAIESGCSFIGIELNAEYHAIATARVEAAQKQRRMF